MGTRQLFLDPRDVSVQAKYWQLAILACRALKDGCYWGSDEAGGRSCRFEGHVYTGISRKPIIQRVGSGKHSSKPVSTIALIYGGFQIELEKYMSWDEPLFWFKETIGARFSRVVNDAPIVFFEAEVEKPKGAASHLTEDDIPRVRHYIVLRDLYTGIEMAIKRSEEKAFLRGDHTAMGYASGDEAARYLGELLKALSRDGDASVIPIASA